MKTKATSIVGNALMTKYIQEGLGRHIFCLPPVQARHSLLWSLLAQAQNILGLCLVKLSICCRVLRVIDRVSRTLRIFIWILIAITIASHLDLLLMSLLDCIPLSAVWDASVKGKCIREQHLWVAAYIQMGKHFP